MEENTPTVTPVADTKYVEGFWRAQSFITIVVGLLTAFGPDMLNWLLLNLDVILSAVLPTLSIEHKLLVVSLAGALSAAFKAYKQKNGPIAIAEKKAVIETVTALEKASPEGATVLVT